MIFIIQRITNDRKSEMLEMNSDLMSPSLKHIKIRRIQIIRCLSPVSGKHLTRLLSPFVCRRLNRVMQEVDFWSPTDLIPLWMGLAITSRRQKVSFEGNSPTTFATYDLRTSVHCPWIMRTYSVVLANIWTPEVIKSNRWTGSSLL